MGNFRILCERSFHQTILGAILDTIAFEHDLNAGIATYTRARLTTSTRPARATPSSCTALDKR
ncbi:hypothetical protein [Oxalicibacterium flavum]|uniref:hypothetical protein n=1 Tax=Oxalicibacterium flavum TaxID=179467 RepID=UPI00166B79B8|nr:hypothetical protein [Oxalicibacterium flavum]